jgi:glycosyltransferase involved in cell wall biosynthesis
MNQPLVSVIIPTYNGARWLKDTLRSVLCQTYARKDVIVVDDGSTDDTPTLLRGYGSAVRVIRHLQNGIGAARNAGLRAAMGDYLAFLDHDDLWRADKLAVQVKYLEEHPDVALLHADAEEFDERGTVHPSYLALFPALVSGGDVFTSLLAFAVPLMSTVVVSAHFLERHSLRFIEDASGVDDLGLFLEIAAHGGTFAVQRETLARRRLHAHNLSKVHVHRFVKRVCLYTALQQRLPGLSARHAKALADGLRDAHFRVGEWDWGQGEPIAALDHFKRALGLDRLGLKASLYAAASALPRPIARGLLALKRRCLAATH